MKKNKWMAVAAGLLLALWAPLSASAAPIIPNPDQPGSITIHKYAVGDLDDFTLPATGSPVTPDAEINNQGDTLADLYPLEGINFTITRVQDTATSPEDAEPLIGGNAFTQTLATNVSGQAAFTGLAQGVYLVEEVDENGLSNPAIETPVDPFLVRVPMTNPVTGTDWIYDVHVYPKNRLGGNPDIELYVTELDNKFDTAKLESDVQWIATVQIPLDVETAVEFDTTIITSDYLEYIVPSAFIYVNPGPSQVVLLGSDYTATWNDAPGGNSLTIGFTPAGRAKLAAEYAAAGVAGREPLVFIEYATTLVIPPASLPSVMGTPIESTVELHYTSSANIPHYADMEDKVQPYVYTGGLRIAKTNAVGGAALPGAEFHIYASQADALAGSNPLTAPGAATPWVVSSGADGFAAFYGLPFGAMGTPLDNVPVPETTYWLVETKAPEGFNLLTAPFSAVVNPTSHLAANDIDIENHAGFMLPVTGGAGIALFVVGGGALVAAGVILFMWTGRRQQRNRKKGSSP